MICVKTRFLYLARFGILAFGLLNALAASSAAADTIIYGGNILTYLPYYPGGDVIEINLTTNSSHKVDDYLFTTQAIAQDPTTSFVYYFENSTYRREGTELAYWDPVTSANTPVRTYESPPWSAAKRAAFDQNGVLYLMDSSGELYTVDTATGDSTYIGQVQGNFSTVSYASGDIAFSPDGVLYLVVDENLYTINMETLVATQLDSNMIPGGYNVWTGLAYCDGALYASDFESSIYRIDLDPPDYTVTQLFNAGYVLNDLTSCSAIPDDENSPPVLDPIDDRSVEICEKLQIFVTATDPDIDDDLTYSASGMPADASFDLETGEFNWTPMEVGDSPYPVTFTVTDNGDPVMEDSKIATITVLASCICDDERDGDVDAIDLLHQANGDLPVNLSDFAHCFGKNDCPIAAP